MEELNELGNASNLDFDPILDPDPIPEPILEPEPGPAPPTDPNPNPLDVPEDTVDSVVKKGEEIPRNDDQDEIPDDEVGRKCCPTRHGCQGATDCDYAYGSYPF